MAWTSDFRQRLRETFPIGLVLEVVRPFNGEGVGLDGWFAASDPALGAQAALLLTPAPRLGSSGIRPQDWAYQEGAWSVTLAVPDGPIVLPGVGSISRPTLQYARRGLKRGALVRLLIGEAGTARGDYQPLKLGRINRVTSRAPGMLEVEVWDISTALRSRLSSTGASADERARLFYGSVGQQDTLTTKYNVGDASVTISGSVTDRFLLETGGRGAVKVVGDSTTFYLSYTAATGSTISGLSASGEFGTTASNASDYEPGPVPPPASGNLVSSTALLEGHPLAILRSVLTSTGDGTNGGLDLYPRPWGMGLPAELLDVGEWLAARNILTPASGANAWRILVEEEVEDPAAWITSVWNPSGIWLAVREGQIVPRIARDPNTATVLISGSVTDQDLVAGDPPYVEWYPQDVPVCYHRSIVNDGASSASNISNVVTLPAYEELTHDTSTSSVSLSNAGAIRTEVSERLAPWDHLCPEYATLVLQGIRSYAPGDILLVTLSELGGRLDGTVGGYAERPCMVVRESIDLAQNRTQITVAALPTSYLEDSP